MLKNKIINQEKSLVISVVTVFCLMFIFNFFTPLLSDDFTYSGAQSLKQAFQFEQGQWYSNNGRSVAHMLARIFLMGDKIWFEVCNAFIYVILTLTLLFHATFGFKVKRTSLYLLINFLIWIFVIDYGQVILWLTGSCNYLWTTTFIMLFLVPFRYQVTKNLNLKKYRILFAFVMLVAGIIAGWCNENTSGGCILMVGLFIGFHLIYKKQKIKLWMVMGLIGNIIGYLFMMSAPGYQQRALLFVDDNTWYTKIINRFLLMTEVYFDTFKYIIIFITIALVILLLTKKAKQYTYLAMLYIFVSLAINYALIFSVASHGGRPMFGATIFLVLACTLLFAILQENFEQSLIPRIAAIAVLGVFSAYYLVFGAKDIIYYGMHNLKRNSYIQKEIAAGQKNIIVNDIEPPAETKWNAQKGLYNNIGNDPNEWPTTSIAYYYGIESIAAVSKKEFELIYETGDKTLINYRNLIEYFNELKTKDYYVFLAVKGDFSEALDQDMQSALQNFGLTCDFSKNPKTNYIGVFKNGENIYEKQSSTDLTYKYDINGLPVEIRSSSVDFQKSGNAPIFVEHYQYSKNSRGLNVVVFDDSRKKVVDRVVFGVEHDYEALR